MICTLALIVYPIDFAELQYLAQYIRLCEVLCLQIGLAGLKPLVVDRSDYELSMELLMA